MTTRTGIISLLLALGFGCRCFAAETPAVDSKDAVCLITLNSTSTGRVFEGIGAVSAGASTRLLLDYPEPQRSQILDFLFKPNFGAGFQHLKVEIGGGENSTCGSEPSHVLTKEELSTPQPRGYEFWFMAEARKRNSEIILDCLPWAYPQWVGTRFSQESADWFVSFLDVARKNYGLEIDWISAAQNEMGTDLNWIRKQLRPTLDARGFSNVKLQAPDDDEAFWKIFEDFEKDPELDCLISAVGYHYVDGRNPWNIDQRQKRHATEKAKQSGKPLWASEEWSQSGREWDGKGALYLARLMNKLYSYDRITKYQIWCPIDSIYEQIIWGDTGAMQADTPWCGHYTVWPAIWAIGHTTQFAKPGWVYMDEACGQMSTNTWRGSHVALRDPKTGDWSVIVVTGEKRVLALHIANVLKQGPVHVWKSTANEQFVKLTTLEPRNQCVQLELEAEAIYTLTSTTGQQKGTFGTPPPRQPFPLPYNEDFESYKAVDTPRYFSDQKGTFEVAKQPDGRLCLAQVVPAQGVVWMGMKLLKPHTLFGDADWKDCSIQADVCLAGGDVELGGRYADRDKLGYRLILARDGNWSLNWQLTTLAKGTLPAFDGTAWHKLRLDLKGNQITGWVDGAKLATVTDASGSKGMAVLASTYDRNLFDNVRVFPVAGEVSAKKPNIVYILCDDLGYGDVKCLGGDRCKITTPNIDRLAAGGMIFTEAHSSSSVCTPTRYGVMTGRYNWRTKLQSGVLMGYSPPLIDKDRLTVPALLKQHGYVTACIGKWHLGMAIDQNNPQAAIGEGPTTRGFDSFFGISASLDMPPFAFIENTRFTEAPTAQKSWVRKGPAAPGFEAVDVLPTLTRKAVDFIGQRAKAENPFFLYLPLPSPHTPIVPTQEWQGKSGLSPYADFVMQTDWSVGQVMEALDKAGIAENTLVMFTSDNGCSPAAKIEELQEKGHFSNEWRRGHKADIWDGGHRIPFIARWPAKIKAGTRTEQIVCLTDLMATSAEIADAKIPDTAGEDSVSLLPVFLGTAAAPIREAVVHHSIRGVFAIRQGQWKLDLCTDSGGWSKGSVNDAPGQLYDMSKDVAEQKNEYSQHPEIVAKLTALLEKYVAEGRSTPGTAQKNDVPVNFAKKGGEKKKEKK